MLPVRSRASLGKSRSRGSRDSAVVRALTSTNVVVRFPDPGSCGFSLLLVVILSLRVFQGFLAFPPSTKTNTSKFQFIQGIADEEGCYEN